MTGGAFHESASDESPIDPAFSSQVGEAPGEDASRHAREKAQLRAEVLMHLENQGFKLTPAGAIAPVETDKSKVRSLHNDAVRAARDRGRAALVRKESSFLSRLAVGGDVEPSRIRPRLVPIDNYRHPDAPLWRWCSLHWSIPVSGGYGRRLRFLVIDEKHENAVIGLLGLADPVFALGCRDSEIAWTAEQRTERLTSVMDAFVLGAVPPYSGVLGGKLMAMLVASREVREAFGERYGHRKTVISERDPDAQLALVTTSSALGRSSVYNRVRRADGSPVMVPVGFTRGSGDFHFSGDIYEKLAAFASAYASASHRHQRWGASGFRNRREVIQKALHGLDLPARALRFHGVQREVFMTPLARNAYEYLRGETDELDFFNESVDEISSFWRKRWAVPRSQRDASWSAFEPESWRLYS